jgi:hypothetical protein
MLLTDNNYYLDNEPVLRLYKDDKLVFPERNYPVTLTIDTSKTAPTDQFFIGTLNNTVYNFLVDWGDNIVENLTATSTGALPFTHTYPVSNQLYNVYISGAPLSGFPYMGFASVNVRERVIKAIINDDNHFTQFNTTFQGCINLRKFTAGVFPSAVNFATAWQNCSSLTEFPAISSLRGTSFSQTWRGCTSLQSFPLIEIPDTATNIAGAWFGCTSLTSFPAINFKNVVTFSIGSAIGTWQNCSSLTTFPKITCNSANNIASAWVNCTSLLSFPDIEFGGSSLTLTNTWGNCRSLRNFPNLNLSRAITLISTWQGCVSLTSFPPLNLSAGTNFSSAWNSCSSLNTFPLITCINATTLGNAWLSCLSLTSFPPISCPNVTNFSNTWSNCISLSVFEFNIDTFSKVATTGGTNCFLNVTLPTQTWSSILTSISATNTNLNVTFHGGNSKRNAEGTTAYAYLTGRGWSITDGGPE